MIMENHIGTPKRDGPDSKNDPLCQAPLPNPALQNHLKACINLVSFVVRISQNYFPEPSLEYEKKVSEKAP